MFTLTGIAALLLSAGGLGAVSIPQVRTYISDTLEHHGLKATPLQKVDALADDLASHAIKKTQQAVAHRNAAERADDDGRRADKFATMLGK